MNAVDTAMLVAGVACWALAIFILYLRVNVLTRQQARAWEEIIRLARACERIEAKANRALRTTTRSGR